MATAPTPPVLDYALPASTARWQGVITVLLPLGLAGVVLTLLFVVGIDIEAIVFAGPVLGLIGSLLIGFGLASKDRLAIAAGGLHLAICTGTFLMIYLAGMSKRRAMLPVIVILVAYAAGLLTLMVCRSSAAKCRAVRGQGSSPDPAGELREENPASPV